VEETAEREREQPDHREEQPNKIVKLAIERPDFFVLKPQREGRGQFGWHFRIPFSTRLHMQLQAIQNE
jgi:hypothetical protein